MVDGDLLLHLTEQDLESDIGMSSGLHRKRFIRELESLKVRGLRLKNRHLLDSIERFVDRCWLFLGGREQSGPIPNVPFPWTVCLYISNVVHRSESVTARLADRRFDANRLWNHEPNSPTQAEAGLSRWDCRDIEYFSIELSCRFQTSWRCWSGHAEQTDRCIH